MDFNIVEASIESLDEFITLLDQVGEWLWNKGVKQWKPGLHHQNKHELAERIEHGALILAYHRKKLAGGCILSEVMPKVWPDAPNALSLSSFVVARFAAGKELGTEIIKSCIQAAAQRGKSRLRLDCWEGNHFLKSYYQREGFKMLEAIEAGGYYVRLFEKEIQNLELIKLKELPSDDLEPLLQESRRQGFEFLSRLVADYANGSNQFRKPGEALFGVYCDQRLIAIGGLNQDPYLADGETGRVRRVYVLASWRGQGVGKLLVQRIIDEARRHYRLLTLRTMTEAASQFYDAIGFQSKPEIYGATHHLVLT